MWLLNFKSALYWHTPIHPLLGVSGVLCYNFQVWMWMHGWFGFHTRRRYVRKICFLVVLNIGNLCIHVFKDLHLIISHSAEINLVQGPYQVLHSIRWNYRSSWESLILSSNPWILRGSSLSFLSESPPVFIIASWCYAQNVNIPLPLFDKGSLFEKLLALFQFKRIYFFWLSL
jgi:hypothetical protein